jgi:hypothetical protein
MKSERREKGRKGKREGIKGRNNWPMAIGGLILFRLRSLDFFDFRLLLLVQNQRSHPSRSLFFLSRHKKKESAEKNFAAMTPVDGE